MKQLILIKKRKRTRGVKLGRPVSTHTGARQRRESFSTRDVLHVTLRLREGLPNLRTRKGAQLVKHAIQGAQAKGVRIVHFAILSNHIHLIVEGHNPQAFYNAMKSFCSRLGIHLRRWAQKSLLYKLDEKGLGLFRGRYFVQILRTPNQMKHALKYVLLNPAKHFRKSPYIDAFTSGAKFKSWKTLIGYNLPLAVPLKILQARLDFLSPPKLWLTGDGWSRAKT